MKDAPPDPDGPSNPVASDPSAYVRQLHRRNEELQVLNEELMVSNEELRQRVREVEERAEGLEAQDQALDERARRLDRELEELRALKREIAAATEGPAVGLVFVDRDGRIARFAGAAAQVFHLRTDDQGRPLADMNHELDYEDLMADVRAVIAEGTIREAEVLDTEGRPYLLRIRPYPRGGEEIEGAVLSITGLTGLRDLDQYLDADGEARESLREREQHLTRQTERLNSFAEVVAHELRSPLMVAQGWVEQAQAAEDVHYLGKVHQALERMDAIMDDVLTLTWSGRELGADELELCDVGRIARKCWEYMHAGSAAVLVTNEVVVQANEPRLERLIENLLRNALTHGGPEVTITVGARADGFFVEDDGPGIPAEKREMIFVPGYSSNKAGSGLGLSITAAIAEAHGWDLSVAGGQEGGARFEITGVFRSIDAKHGLHEARARTGEIPRLRETREEMKAQNEELETSKEELESLNEELQTVNNQLEEVSRAHSDMQNLIAATEVGTIFLDRGLQIQRFTPPVREFFRIGEGDTGRPIRDLTHELDYEEMEADAEAVLEDLRPREREVTGPGETRYLVRARPYGTVENQIDGVVFTFVDITDQKHAQEELRRAKEYAYHIVDTVREGLLVLDPEFRVETASTSFCELFEIDREATEGTFLYELGNGQWDIPELRELLDDVLPENNVFNGYEVTHTFEQVGERTMLLNGRRLDHVQKILLAIEDITERKQAQDKLRSVNEELRREITERERLEQEVLQVSEEERRRIGESLHEEAGQTLTGVDMILGDHIHRLKADEPVDIEDVEYIRALIRQVDEQLIDLARGVIPLMLGENETLRRALEQLTDQMEERLDCTCQITLDGDLSFGSDERATHLYWIVQEAVQNAALHGNASAIEVTLHENADERVLRVCDNGSGSAKDLKNVGADGLGLRLVQYRCRLLQGHFSIEDGENGGLCVRCRFPVEDSSRRESS